MKTLITAADIKNRVLGGEKQVYLDKDFIVTPAARDTAREMRIELVYGRKQVAAAADSCVVNGQISEGESWSGACEKLAAADQGDLASLISKNLGNDVQGSDLVERIVNEVLAVLGHKGLNIEPMIEKDESGLRLVRGDSVVCEPFATGNPRDRVFLKNLLPIAESPNMGAGFMEMENSSFEWELKYDEYIYVIDGELEIIVDGQAYRGNPGDVFFIPKGTRIVFSSPGKVKFLYVAYPANWQEQE